MTSDQETKPQPEETEHELDFPTLTHRYRQQGNEAYCTLCPQRHGFFVPVGVKMSGEEEDGTPIFTRYWTPPEGIALSESVE